MKSFVTTLVLLFAGGWSYAQFSAGTGTPGDPYQITSPAELNNVRNYLGVAYAGTCFRLMNDIDLTGYLAIGGDGYTLWGDAGWDPIGKEFSEFYGQFDGNEHAVLGLKINRNEYYVGLFGTVQNGCSLCNLWVGIDPAGSVTGNAYVGALIGQNYGTVSYCYAMFGSVSGGYAGDMLIGGLIGQNDGCILNCFAMVAVSGSWSVGGLAGYNHSGIISNCFATGFVSVGGNLGGLAGANGGTITNSFATGLVGGGISGGGLVASNTGTVENSYWDTETTGRTTSSGSDPSYGKLTVELKTQSTFVGWDFTAPVWTLGSGNNNGYPFLSSPVQASAIVFSDIENTRMTIGWTNGNEAKRAVFIKQANTGISFPVNNFNYSADPVFGNGTQIGSTGWYCVYNGTGTSVTVTGLTMSTDYIFQVFEYQDACGAKYNISTATGNPLGQATTGLPPIEVTATAATPGPTLYYSLNAAFRAINAGTHQGDITVKILGNSIETATAFLNRSDAPSSYNSVNIYPTLTGLSISGNLAAPLIDLRAAGHVTLNGSLNGLDAGKDLTITNTSTSDVKGTSTIRFIGDAFSNTVKYCTIKGSTTSNESGVVFFGASMSDGNDNNTIDHNDITNAENDKRPVIAVYSNGSTAGKAHSGPGDIANSENNITNNHIFDFFNPDYSSDGILLDAHSTDWNITGNSFYETTNFEPLSNNGMYYCAIDVYNIDGTNFKISDNFIGGSAPACSGRMTLNGATDYTFYGIYLDAGKSVESSIQNNSIQNIDFTVMSESNNNWTGIYLNNGAVNVGTVKGNTIGSSTGNGSIMVTNSSTDWRAGFTGIANWSGDAVHIQNNIIGSITTATAPGSEDQSFDFYGISNFDPLTNISDNIIGSTTTANSINAASPATNWSQEAYGIYSEKSCVISGNTIANLTNGTTSPDMSGSGNIIGIWTRSGSNTITNNTIHDLTIGCANSGTYVDEGLPAIIGILQGSSTARQIITGNTIYNLSDSYPDFEGSVIGLYYMGGSAGYNVISKNFIHSLSVTGASSTAASLFGIRIAQGTSNFYNNVISLGGNTATDIFGIYEDENSTDYVYFVFNTVYIGGSLDAGATNSSFALYSGGFFGYAEFIDNIFHNARSTAAGSELHFAAYFEYDSRPSLTCDYNDYFAPGTGGMLGSYSTATNTLPIVTGQDTHSLNINPYFVNAGGTVAANYIPTATLNGTGSEGYPRTDYAGTTRDDTPTMGAFEKIACANPTDGGSISANQAGCYPFDPALITCTDATGQTGTLDYQWQSSPDNSIFSDITGATSTNFDPGPLTVTTYFKRKARVTCMGTWTGATESAVAKMTVNESVSATAVQGRPETCSSDGIAAVTASGGTPDYTYTWSTTPSQHSDIATGLVAGVYTVTVMDANSCATTASVTVVQLPAGPVTTLGSKDIINHTQFIIPVTVDNFSDIGAINLTFTYDPLYLQVIDVTNNLIPLAWSTDLNSSVPGKITIASFGGTTAFSLPNASDLVYITFKALAPTSSTPLTWNALPPTACEYANLFGEYVYCRDPFGTFFKNGSVKINSSIIAGISSKTDVKCFGGSDGTATVTASGGATTAYYYLWNNSQVTATATGLSAGTYTVQVSDASSSAVTATVEIMQPLTALSAAADQGKSVSCSGGNDGAVTVTPAGGWGGYSYFWNNGQTAAMAGTLTAGTYTVTVTDLNGCTITATAVVAGPGSALTVTAGQSKPETCGSDGYATAEPAGGWGGYGYLWNNGQTLATASGLTAGIYTVTVTDIESCSVTATVHVYSMGHGPVTTITPQLVCHETNTVDIPFKVSYFTNVGGFSLHLKYNTAELSTPTLVAGSLPPGIDAWGQWSMDYLSTPGTIKIGDFGSSASDKVTLPPTTTLFTLRFTILSGVTTSAITFDDGPLGGYCEYIGYTPDGIAYPFCDKPLDQYYIPGSVTVNPLLVASITGKTDVHCNGGNNGTATVSASGGTAGYKYLWNNSQTTATAINLTAGTYSVTVTDANTCTATTSVSITQPSALSAVINSKVDILCHGNATGSATVSVSGGVAAYAYLWNTVPAQHSVTATGLTAGSYTVTVTDANTCAITASVSIAEPATLIAGISNKTDVQCFGGNNGTATVTVSGGTTNYTYLWSTVPPQNANVASGLTVGVYTVTVADAHSCQATASVQIIGPAALSASATHVNVTCFGGNNGSVTVSASGGSTPYHYLWSDVLAQTGITATGLTAGTYTVTVTDFCSITATASAVVTQPNEITVSAGPNQYLCQQTYAVLYGDPQTGLWSQDSPVTPVLSFFPIPATNMTLVMGLQMLDAVPFVLKYTVTVGPCSKSATMQLFNYHYPSVPYAGPDQNLCYKAPPLNYVTMAAAVPLYGQGTWTPVAGTPPHTIVNVNDPRTQITYTIPGTYKFLWTVKNGSCDPDGLNHDTCVVKVFAPPAVDAGPNAGVCGSASYCIVGSTASGDCMTLAWTTSGTGTFTDATILHPCYTPSAADIAAGCVTLTLTGTVGCCSPCGPATVSDFMTLCFHPVPVPTAFVLSNVSCHGSKDGSVTVTVTGGTTPYSYLWSNLLTTQTITGLGAGAYTVTVTDANSCTATSSALVTEPAALTILSSVVNNVNCFTYSTGSIDLTVGGGTTPYAYHWNNGQSSSSATGLSAGTYTVTVSDAHSCSLTQSWTVTQPPAWSIGIIGPITACCSLSAPFTTSVYTATVGGSYLPPVTYQWVVEGGTILSGQNTQSITVSWACCGSGKVWLTVTDSRPCTLTTFIVVTVNPTPAPDITGPAEVVAGQTNTHYCTADIPGHLYTWTVVGGSVTSGQGTHCITVTWGPYPACGCGSVTVCETFNGCTGCDTYPVSILPGANIKISGYMSYDNLYLTKLNGVTVQLRNTSNGIVGTTVTINNPDNGLPGYYAFSNIADGTYHLTGSYDGTWGGNNATDALIVQLNVIGAYPLFDLRDTCADVNGSLVITGLDALYIKLRTIGSITSYPAGDWKILPKTVVITGGAPVTQDMLALCEGDVNGSFIPVGFKETNFLSQTGDGVMNVPVGEPFVYNIHSSSNAELGAMTLFMGYDPDRFEVIDIASANDGMKYAFGDGKISIAWADTKPLKVNAGDQLLSLNLRVKSKITEPSRVFTLKPGSEFADMQASPYDNFELKMPNVQTSGGSQDLTMYNYPNPFAGTTTIAYTLPETGHARLVLTDLYGKTISVLVDQQDKAGSHAVTVDPAALNMTPGVYLYKIIFDSATDTYVKVNKMVFTR